MGTSGSGRITDYPGGSGGGGSGGGHGAGGSSGVDRCGKAFSANLEEVEQCDYFKHHNSGPPAGTKVDIKHKKRIVVETEGGESVGFLPTKFNYVAQCIADGYSYSGKVTFSKKGPPVAVVTLDVAPDP